ncbi:hypothetical protein AMK26_27635 [Streptomyces sp. CB03234]|uniref:hypothetical protein n=1 Tax=Streptomyces sp. (strain CB03234) TaxID=1703937 RepID=UPI00093B12E7|nr:hypothetical protein [Streptomyces sp. CB03234]OKJ99768.1 hypothetical protein AMK26_27635 [Streptomyces sp. CB03234]
MLLDVNGTLVPSLPGPPPDAAAFAPVARLARLLGSAGIRVGLCSDSPLEQLWAFGRVVGLGTPPGFPVVAENGNVVAVGGAVRVMTPFPARQRIRTEVAAVASAHRLVRAEDATAPEFGGVPPARHAWAFGANRRASVSVFGPPEFIGAAERHLTGWAVRHRVDMSVELGPDRTYLGIHPYARTRLGKRRALARLAREEHRHVLMVGNSPADWVPDAPGVTCAFVGDADIPDDVREAAWYVSGRAGLDGVVDILDQVIRRRSPLPAE